MQFLQHLDISTTSTKNFAMQPCLFDFYAMDHDGNLLDQSRIGICKHNKTNRHSLHKLNAP
jgi:hypothetical protein